MPTLILLIESDQVTRTLIRYHLVRAGYAVEEAAPDDVLRMLRTRSPRLVIADEESLLGDGQSMDDLWERAPEASAVPLLLLADVPPPGALSPSAAPQPASQPRGPAGCRRPYLARPVLAHQLLSGIGAMLARA